MKSWRKLRNELALIFQGDKIKYKIESEKFEISGKTFIKEEMDSLLKFCYKNRFWFYLYSVGEDTVIIVEKWK